MSVVLHITHMYHQSSADEARQHLHSAWTSLLVVRRTRLSTIGEIEIFRSLLPDCGTFCR